MPATERPQRKGRSVLDVVDSLARARNAAEARDLERLRLEAEVLRLRQEETAQREARDRRLAEEYRATRGRTGRPKGSGRGRFTREQLLTADRKLKQEHGRSPTQEELAEELDTPVRTLQDRLVAEEIPWPIPD